MIHTLNLTLWHQTLPTGYARSGEGYLWVTASCGHSYVTPIVHARDKFIELLC